MNTNRKISITILSIAVARLLLVCITVAYLSDASSVLTSMGMGACKDENGNIRKAVMLSLTEPSFAKQAGTDNVEHLTGFENEVTSVSVFSLMPGDKIFKNPTIKNDGTDSVYLRVKIDMTDALMAKLSNDLGLTITNTVNGAIGYFVKGADGYYYYTKDGSTCAEFKTGEVVDLFKTTGSGTYKYSMTIPETWKNSDITAFLGTGNELMSDMPIVAQAIQFRNYDPGSGLAWTGVADADIEEVALAERAPIAPTP